MKLYQHHDAQLDRGKAAPHPKRQTMRTSRGRHGVTLRKSQRKRWDALLYFVENTKRRVEQFWPMAVCV